MGFVNDDEVECAPVELSQVDVPGPAFVAAQVRMGKHGVAEAGLLKWVVAVGGAGRVAHPVLLQALGAKH